MRDYLKIRNTSEAWKLIFLSFFVVFACAKDDTPMDPVDDGMDPNGSAAVEYIFVAHTRTNSNSNIFDKVLDIDFSKFDLKMLGGDLALESFANASIIKYLDNIFDFKNEKTLFSVGNHDVTSDQQFFEVTNKNKFSLYQTNDISFITLDSQKDMSSIIGPQKEFLFNVLDSLSTKNVILFTHKLIYMVDHPVMDNLIGEYSNGPRGSCSFCLNPNNFQEEIYPKLLETRGRGKNIYWVAGDLGVKETAFEYKDGNGITFLGNGLWFQATENQVLIFSKDDAGLTYRFKNIEDVD